ncbi:LysR family transcriptional regulator [Ideonella sp.]|uniref:LysR family transcriptional regulator n=1 Tax=Ideonella sp. TaxID=1929293 RepID=UPI003BB55B5B
MTVSNTLPRPEIPFSGLVAFVATARLGNISRAADELALTQSAVSQRILKLEAHVGQRLFIRQGHGVRLTGAGELLLSTARDTLDRLQAGIDRIEPYRNRASLLLACPPDFAHGWLMPRLHALRALHPAMEVWLMADRELSDIDRIDVDLIVSRRPLRRTDIDCRPWLSDESVLVCGPRTAQRLAAKAWPRLLEHAPVLLLESEPEWSGLLAQPALKKLKLSRAATIQDERLLLDAVRHEAGIARVSSLLADQALRSGEVVQLAQAPATPRAGLWLMRSTLTPRTPLVTVAHDWLQAQGPAGALS